MIVFAGFACLAYTLWGWPAFWCFIGGGILGALIGADMGRAS